MTETNLPPTPLQEGAEPSTPPAPTPPAPTPPAPTPPAPTPPAPESPSLPDGVRMGVSNVRNATQATMARSASSRGAQWVPFVKMEHRLQDPSGAKQHKVQMVDAASDLQTIPCTEWVVYYAGGDSGIDHNSPLGRGRANCHILLRIEDIGGVKTATAFHTYEVAPQEMTMSMAPDIHRGSEIEVMLPYLSDGFEWFHVVKWPIAKWSNDPRRVQHLLTVLDQMSEITVGMIIDGVGRIDRFSENGKSIIVVPDEIVKPVLIPVDGVVGGMAKPV